MSKLNADRITDSEFTRRVHRVNVPVDILFQELLDPTFWGHVASKFTKGDKIEALAEDGTWYAELLVRDCSRVHASVASLLFKAFSTQTKAKDEVKDPDFSTEWKGPQRKFAIIRTADKEIIKDAFASKEDAAVWLEANRASLTLA